MTPQWQRWYRLWPLLLAAVYVALIPLLAGLENVPGVTYLLGTSAAACLLVCWARYAEGLREIREASGHGSHSSTISLPAPLERPHSRWASLLLAPLGLGIDALRGLPSAILWLPLPVSLSWVAAIMARVQPDQADYNLAFGLWVVALVLFVAVFLAPLVVDNRRKLSTLVRAIPWPEVAAVAVITGVAFAVRLVALADEPSPFWSDEGISGLRGLEILKGDPDDRINFFDMASGIIQPKLYYATMIALSFKLFGSGVLAVRLLGALLAAATVPLLYLLLRELFDRRVALVGAAFLAIYHFHLHFSRIAANNVLDTFFAVLVLYWAFRAIRTQKPLDFALTGLATGLMFYFSSIGARVVPMVPVLLLALMVVKTRGTFVLRNFWGLTTLLTGFVIAVLPAALYFDGTPGAVTTRWEELNIFDSGWLDGRLESTGHSELQIIWDQVQHAFGFLVVYKETTPHYNADIPLLTGISSIFFVIGGVYALFHIFQPRFFALFTLLVLTAVLLGALLIPPLTSHRYLATVPVSAAFVAVGVVLVGDVWAKFMPRWRSYAPVLMGALVLLIAFVNLSFYFGTYLPSDNFGNSSSRVAGQVADHLEPFDDSYAVYFLSVSGFNVREPALQFRAQDKVLVDVWGGGGEMRNTYEGGRNLGFGEEAAAARRSKSNALFLVPTARAAELLRIREQCPNGVSSETITTPVGHFSYRWYEVSGSQACVDALERQGIIEPSLG